MVLWVPGKGKPQAYRAAGLGGDGGIFGNRAGPLITPHCAGASSRRQLGTAGASTPSWCLGHRGCASPCHWPPGTGTALTLHVTHAVLADHPGVVLLVCRPLVDEHGCVGRPGVQHDAILQGGGSRSGWRQETPGCPRPSRAKALRLNDPAVPGWSCPAWQLQKHLLAEASAAQPSTGTVLPMPACMGPARDAAGEQGLSPAGDRGYCPPQDVAWHSTGTPAFWARGPPLPPGAQTGGLSLPPGWLGPGSPQHRSRLAGICAEWCRGPWHRQRGGHLGAAPQDAAGQRRAPCPSCPCMARPFPSYK